MSSLKRTSAIKSHNGMPVLFVDGRPVFAAAYISYLDDRARYKDFKDAGYSIFSFPVYFAGRGINVYSGIGPFRKGIFDDRDKADFDVFDHDVKLILEAQPDAMIFPRICLDMPEWWEMEYPDELNVRYGGEPARVSMSSQQWRKDAGEMLAMLIDHIEAAPYCNNIIGYQVAAGGTEEWVHFGNHNGGLGDAAQKGFTRYVLEKYDGDTGKLRRAYGAEVDFDSITIPSDYHMYDNKHDVFFTKEYRQLLDFLEYTNWIVADDIIYFCSIVKAKTDHRLVAGAFYGYTTLLTDARNGHHSIKTLLDSNNIDFICSPYSYNTGRAGGIDWPCMSVPDSVKLAGKLFMHECDTRTHLTRPLKEARPSIAPAGFYEGGVWQGPENEQLSKWYIRKSFARTLITGDGLWWFDMWGGWFASDVLMKELSQYVQIQSDDLNIKNRCSISQIAVITDESSLKYLNSATGIASNWIVNYLTLLGSTGTIYDIFDLHNCNMLKLGQYKLLIFLGTCNNSSKLQSLVSSCRQEGVNLCFTYLPGFINNDIYDIDNASVLTGIKLGILEQGDYGPVIHANEGWELAPKQTFQPVVGIFDDEAGITGIYNNSETGAMAAKKVGNSMTYYCALPEITLEAMRYICSQAGVHLYCEAGNVIYANSNYICIHSASEGVKHIFLPVKSRVERLLDGCGEVFEGNSFDVLMDKYETVLYKIHNVNDL